MTDGDPSGPVDAPLSATVQVADALADMILRDLAPGASIPSEADLAQRFAVSRLTVREAIKMLTGRGLLDVGRGRRAIVREPDSSAFADFLISILRNDQKGMFDLIELRMTIETQSAGLAAKRASRAGIQAIETAIRGMREANLAIEAGEEQTETRFHDCDVQFHEAIATASGNRVISFLFEAMSRPLREAFGMSRHGQTLRGNGRRNTIIAHQAVLDAIKAGNQRAAAEAMRAHLKETETDIRAHINSRGRI